MPIEVGSKIGTYEITAQLGVGGMGSVYRAHDDKLERPVAIKLLRDDFADAEACQRFEREARTASSLNHPHIVSVYDVGEVDGQQYLVTELVDGGTLREWAEASRPSWKQVVGILIGIADALAAAHRVGVLHRDLKPENIFVDASGYAKLADFGLAKLIEPVREGSVDVTDETTSVPAVVTRPGTILGTMSYLSPEQAAGRPSDARSDLFGLAVVLYELLANRKPFDGNGDLELLAAIRESTPAPLPESIPWALRFVVDKALEKDPADRYQTAQDFVVDLRRVRRLAPERLNPQVMPSGRRATGPRWAWLGVAALAIFAGLILWLSRDTESWTNPLANAPYLQITDFPGQEFDADISPNGQYVTFVSDRNGPFQAWVGSIRRSDYALVRETPAYGAGGVRGVGFSGDGSEVWILDEDVDLATRLKAYPLVAGGKSRNLLRSGVQNLDWSPLDGRVAFHTMVPGDPLYVSSDALGTQGEQLVHREPSGRHQHHPKWSPDGEWIYIVRGYPATGEMDLWRIRPRDKHEEQLTENLHEVAYPTPMPDNRTVFFVAKEPDGAGPWLWALDLESRVSRRAGVGAERYTSVAASGDGKRLVVTISNPGARLWTVPIGEETVDESAAEPLVLPTLRASAPRYSGNDLYYLSSRGTRDGLWRFRDGEAEEILPGTEYGLAGAPAISPDGTRVAIRQVRPDRQVLTIVRIDGTGPRTICPDLDVSGGLSWSPRGDFIVAAGQIMVGAGALKPPKGIFKIDVEGEAYERIVTEEYGAIGPVWSPDGELIVYSGPQVGPLHPVRAVKPDGSRFALPPFLEVHARGERYRFLPDPDRRILICMMGDSRLQQDFWRVDLDEKDPQPKRLTHLGSRVTMLNFDLLPDGSSIIFDRVSDDSNLFLIELDRDRD